MVLKFFNLIEDLLDFWYTMGRTDPELFLRILEALSFDILDLVYAVVSLLTPLELFVEEIKHSKVETP